MNEYIINFTFDGCIKLEGNNKEEILDKYQNLSYSDIMSLANDIHETYSIENIEG